MTKKWISLTRYFHAVGKSLYPDYSKDTLKISTKEKLSVEEKAFYERYKKIKKKVRNHISTGKVDLRVREFLGQGYVPATFKISTFDYLNSVCRDINGKRMKCQVLAKVKTSLNQNNKRGPVPLLQEKEIAYKIIDSSKKRKLSMGEVFKIYEVKYGADTPSISWFYKHCGKHLKKRNVKVTQL